MTLTRRQGPQRPRTQPARSTTTLARRRAAAARMSGPCAARAPLEYRASRRRCRAAGPADSFSRHRRQQPPDRPTASPAEAELEESGSRSRIRSDDIRGGGHPANAAPAGRHLDRARSRTPRFGARVRCLAARLLGAQVGRRAGSMPPCGSSASGDSAVGRVRACSRRPWRARSRAPSPARAGRS